MILSSAVAALVGGALGFAAVWFATVHARRQAQDEASSRVALARREAEMLRREETAGLQVEHDGRRAEMEREARRLEMEIDFKLGEIKSHEESLAALDHELRLREKNIQLELDELRANRKHLQDMTQDVRRTMAKMASMDIEEVKAHLREQVRLDCSDELAHFRKDLLERSEADVSREAKRTLLAAMQRIASRPSSDSTATVVQLPNDDMKGRIIGREGRNIKCFENATGTTLLIDESPQVVLVSSFDPIRREIAKIALERLVLDGRIHPATIEEFVSEAKNDTEQIIENAGEAAVIQLKISRLHPEIVHLVGKLKFRTSYSQNALEHSVEVGFLCSIIASELGLDPNIAKRAGLLHDIGKVIDGEYEGSHATVGGNFIKMRGEDDVVVNAVAAHHDEVPAETLYAGIVVLADTISAVRPGARSESISSYIDRLKALESLALSLDGVRSAYAIQAGREVRVLVDPEALDDLGARSLSQRLRDRIEESLDYPSSIRITVIREQRFVDTAK